MASSNSTDNPAAPAPHPDAADYINEINRALDNALATLDLLRQIPQESIDELPLCYGTFDNALHGAMERIREAKDSADWLNGEWYKARRAVETLEALRAVVRDGVTP